LDALQRGVDLGDQLALAVAGAQFDRAVGFGGGAVGEGGGVDVLLLQGLQGELRFLEDLVLPAGQLQAKIFALTLVPERLFFGRSAVLQLFQGQPISTHWRRIFAVAGGRNRFPARAPYIATPRDRQYRRALPGPLRPGFRQEPVRNVNGPAGWPFRYQ